MKVLRALILGAALLLTWTLAVWHRAVLVAPPIPQAERDDILVHGAWYPREKYRLNQMFVYGTPYQRGYASGQLAKSLMEREEAGMVAQLRGFFPSPIVRGALITGLMRWFWGIDRYVDPDHLREMLGTAQAASHAYDDLLDGYSRQLAYHGLHEVGQMFVDVNRNDMGCTVLIEPATKGFIVGRNFDFEGPRLLDEEKIVKFIRPEQGHEMVGVIWAGMVGLVTGVNERGVYVSINAAGSSDFRRYGAPTTLAVLHALERASTAEEAVASLRAETTFITDIFVVGDDSHFYRLEKSPRRSVVLSIEGPTAIANHLIAREWEHDRINHFRKTELTSQAREARGKALLAESARPGESALSRMLRHLRDRATVEGEPLPLGSRQAIDPLIATHSVIYETAKHRLYVGEGPSVAGRFFAFDLDEAFAGSGPARIVDTLPADPLVTPAVYARVREAEHFVALAERELKQHHCSDAEKALRSAEALKADTSRYFAAKGDWAQCSGNKDAARRAWEEALRRHPAYAAERRALEKKLGS